jgi:long-chain fatty acid transport protein
MFPIKYVFTFSFFFIFLLINAQGFQVNLQGQAQQGMGGAGVAYAQDAASLFFNPGSSSFVKENSININANAGFANSKFLDKNTHIISETKSPTSTPFAAYGIFQLKDSAKLKLGLAVYTPFGSTVQWQDNWTGRFTITKLQLLAIYIQPTVSYKLTKKIGIGAGFIFATGKVNLQKDIPVIDVNGNYGHAELEGKANGYGYNLGIYYNPIPKFFIGLTYRSQVNMNVKNGEAKFTVPSSLSVNFPDGKFTSSLPLPSVTILGFAYKLTSKTTLALDINYTGWKAYDTLAFDYENNTTSLIDTKSARNYKNTFAFRFGGDYKISEQLIARLGIAFALSPVPDGYVTPETPDANRINYTAGLGYNFKKHFTINASFLFTTFKREGTNIETNLSGTYKTNVVIPGLSIIYKF